MGTLRVSAPLHCVKALASAYGYALQKNWDNGYFFYLEVPNSQLVSLWSCHTSYYLTAEQTFDALLSLVLSAKQPTPAAYFL
jgi:hypothetical protein